MAPGTEGIASQSMHEHHIQLPLCGYLAGRMGEDRMQLGRHGGSENGYRIQWNHCPTSLAYVFCLAANVQLLGGLAILGTLSPPEVSLPRRFPGQWEQRPIDAGSSLGPDAAPKGCIGMVSQTVDQDVDIDINIDGDVDVVGGDNTQRR